MLLLTLFHLCFFRRFYFQNPYAYACGELLEQGFSCSVHLGRSLRRGQWLHVEDPYYYPSYNAIPFLCTYYPVYALQAWVGSWLSLDGAWLLFMGTILLHVWAASLAVYALLLPVVQDPWIAGAMAITLPYCGYAIKAHASIMFTLCWGAVFLAAALAHVWWLLGLSLGMMLLTGYVPVTLLVVPLGCCCWLWRLGS